MSYSVRSTPSDSHCRPQTRDLAISNQNQKRHQLLDRPALWQPSISPQIRPTPNPGLSSTCIWFDRKATSTVGRPAVPQEMVNSTFFLPVRAGCSSGCLEVLFPCISPPLFTFSVLFLSNLSLRSLSISFLFRPIPEVPPKNSFGIGAAHYTPPVVVFFSVY